MALAATAAAAGATAVPQTRAGVGNTRCSPGKLDYDIRIAMGGSVARPMDGLARAVGAVAGAANETMAAVVPAGNVREGSAVRPPAVGGSPVARATAVAGAGLDVAPLAVWGIWGS
jgi:hypothetical protein